MTVKAPNIAVLLATYNGAPYVEAQIRSFTHNTARFTLHWFDDHSTDDTRQIVQRTARELEIELVEWRHPQHQGPWGAFFQLLEKVDADLYLLSDQDDLWEPGKIDVTVAHLRPALDTPMLCFSDPWMFRNEEPEVRRSMFSVLGQTPARALEPSRLFLSAAAFGHTQGFTRPLRDLLLSHKEIAREHAMGHDWWLYLLAMSAGTAKMMFNVPTTLYRRHGRNFSDIFMVPQGNWIAWKWRLQQMLRRGVARQARGFLLAAPTLPPSAKLDAILPIANRVARLDRQQSPAELYRLIRDRILWPGRSWAIPFAIACLLSDAEPDTTVPDSITPAPTSG